MGLLEAICSPCSIVLLILADPSRGRGLGSVGWLSSAAFVCSQQKPLEPGSLGISLSIRPGTAALLSLSPQGTWFWCDFCPESLLNPPMGCAPAFSCISAPVGRAGASPHLTVSTVLMGLLLLCMLSVVRWDPAIIFLGFPKSIHPI